MDEDLTFETVIDQLEKNVGFLEYTIGRERHEKGGYHFHVVLVARKKYDIRSPEKLYLKHRRKVYKPKCDKVDNLTEAVN